MIQAINVHLVNSVIYLRLKLAQQQLEVAASLQTFKVALLLQEFKVVLYHYHYSSC